MKIVVASTNPVKINATEIAFKKMFPGETVEMIGIESESGVPAQPMGEEETYSGAINRTGYAAKKFPKSDFWVGIEGGIEENKLGLCTFGCIAVKGKSGKFGYSRASGLFLPPRVIELIHEGMELGQADDLVFGRTNSKQANGTVGILTKDVLTRTDTITEGVVLALVPFVNPDLY